MEGDVQQANAKATKMESSLIESKHELLRVQEMLELAGKELEKKVCIILLHHRQNLLVVAKHMIL